jgi:dGTPase
VADIIAYVNHDMDDALRAGIIHEEDLPVDIKAVVGDRHSKRTGAMVRDLIVETLAAGDGRLHFSPKMLKAITDLRTFLYENVYRFYKVHNEFEKAQRVIRDLYHYFLENGLMERNGVSWEPRREKHVWASEKIAHRRVCDFIAGMTDRYALSLYEHIFLPKPWNV